MNGQTTTPKLNGKNGAVLTPAMIIHPLFESPKIIITLSEGTKLQVWMKIELTTLDLSYQSGALDR